jgi:uncharacterized protein with NAD-binding domain and iron-sulfur cluster
MPRGSKRRRIVILGGGVGAMTAAFELTDRPGWQDEYQITVYQLGWRLGGKGASGRNLDVHDRIEEHGLHVWLGFYDNAFDLIQRCYRELGRPRGAPLARWQDAFKSQDLVVFEEYVGGRWIHWPLRFAGTAAVPGRHREAPSPWDYIPMILGLMRQVFFESSRGKEWHALPAHLADKPAWWDGVIGSIGAAIGAVAIDSLGSLLESAHALAHTLDKDPRRHSPVEQQAIPWILEKFLDRLWSSVEGKIESDDTARRMWIGLDLGAAIVSGMIRDGLIFHGFDFIDDLELREWLASHGASKVSLDSALVRAGYDLVFGFCDGDPQKPSLAAGVGLRGALRLYFDYKGAVAWEMQAGMGDTIFAPIYEVLKRRGVKFEFFHRVKSLRLGKDRTSITAIDLGRQVHLKERAYDPLVPIKGLPCWPSEPLYGQIVEGEALKRDRVNLESFWTSWTDVGEVRLRRGADFDTVVLGISLGALPYVCPELLAASERWRNMVKHVKTVRTQAFQLWLKPSLDALGWKTPKPILATYVEPIDTWADLSHLVDRESWPPALRPGHIAYFCGPMEGSDDAPPGSDLAFVEDQANRVKATALEFLDTHVRHLWPKAVRGGSQCLDWELLVDSRGGAGRERFDSQFWRANVDPSERYVLSIPGSTKHRLPSGDSGFDNLYLAGDWTANGLNAGCVEAAVISGMQASRAISGHPKSIIGEKDRVLAEWVPDSSDELWSLLSDGIRSLRFGLMEVYGWLVAASRLFRTSR